MKLTVLIDNNTLIDRYFLAEPGVSYLIEDGGKKILFDVGYSDAFITNARKLSINLLDVDEVVLSHGHLDHTWGLEALVRLYSEATGEKLPVKKPRLVAHPLALSPKKSKRLAQLGTLLAKDKLSSFFQLELRRAPLYLTERLVFLGEIERTNNFEAQKPLGKVIEDGVEKDDFLVDDTALAYQSARGLIIITGCSHSGICNITEYARKVCSIQEVADIIGGFHLLNPPAAQLQGTLEYLKTLQPGAVHACHCTDLNSKIALAKVANIQEVGVGLSLEY
jgi:7,8-dihydropterin-6-yl-methyl-4-(beta-D-ribofuranosyl)aminobenzene 5'-phosphate synthase